MKRTKKVQMRDAAPRSHSGLPETRAAIDSLGTEVADALKSVKEGIQASNERLAAVGEDVTSLASRVDSVDGNVVDLRGRIEAVESRFDDGRKDDEEKGGDAAKRYKNLIGGDMAQRMAEVGERIKNLEASQQRALSMAIANQSAAQKKSKFAQAIAGSNELRGFIERDCPPGEAVRFRVPRILDHSEQRAGLVMDSSFLSALSQDFIKSGVIEFLKDPAGLVDVLNGVPPIAADTYKYIRMTSKSVGGHVATQASAAVDGDPTPKTEVPVKSAIGFVAGQDVVIHTAGGAHTETIVSVDLTTPKLVFGSNEIDFDIAQDDDITGTEYLATAEGGEKPAGLIEAEELSVDLQAVATYLILTRQRMRNSNVTDLARYVEGLLPQRTKENLEWHLLYGSGTSNQLNGFLSHASLSTDTWSTDLEVGDTRADLILYSACQIPTTAPLVCIMHKKDWFRIGIAKTDDGHYVHNAGAPLRIVDTPNLKAIGSIRVVLSPAIAQSTALVLQPEAASDLVQHADDPYMVWGWINAQLIENKMTALYEESVGHAIKDYTAFRKCYFDSAPS